MVVSLTWALSSGASSAADPYDHGTVGAGTSSTVDLYIRHDGTNKITSCSWLIQPYTGTGYTGTAGVLGDYNEIIGWGDTYYDSGTWLGIQGGFFINQNASGGFPGINDDYFYTQHGTAGNGIQLASTATGSSAAGELNSGDEAHIKVGIYVPTGTTAGLRFVDQCLTYDYTS